MSDRQPTVLIIDDSPADTQTVRRWLRDSFEVSTADRGDLGLALAATHRPDALLLDYVLPDMTGLEFLAERGPGHDEDCTVIILTGHADLALAVECMKHGADDYLTKGRFGAEDLRRALANGLEKVAMRRQVRAQQRQLEHSLAQFEELNRTLEDRVAQRTRELSLANAELQRTQAALHASEDRYRHLVEDQTEAICRLQADGTVLYVNEEFARWFGGSRESWIGRHWQPTAWPDGAALLPQGADTLSPTHPVFTIEGRILTAGNEVRWGQFVIRAFFDDAGQLLEMQSVARDMTERKGLELRLTGLKEELEDFYEHAPCGYHSLARDGTFLRINETELNWLGCRREEVVGRMKITEFITPTGRTLFQESFPRFLRDGHIDGLEFDLIAVDGSSRRVSLRASAITDAHGGYLRSRSVFYDISELTSTHEKLRRLTCQQQAMLDNEMVGIARVRDRRVVWSNRAMARLLGYEPGALDGEASRVLYPDDAAYEKLGEAAYPILKSRGIFRTQTELLRKDGARLWVDASGALLDGEEEESLWMLVDITPMKRHYAIVEHLAYHDALTDLPNRLLISDRLRQLVAQAQRSRRLLAVCYLDLDGFKPVNDTFGHAAGDRLLQEIGNRIQAVLRAHDSIGRLGGDEFVLLLSQLTDLADCRGVLQRVSDAINQPVVLNEATPVSVTASIGVSLYPSDLEDPDALLRRADQAMYEAKNLGRNQVCIAAPAGPGPTVAA